MELILARHAEPERGAVEAADPGLSELGRRQAQALADCLAPEHLDAIWCSPLRRASETADALAAVVGLPVEVNWDLAEFDRDAAAYLHFYEPDGTVNPRYEAFLRDDLSEWGTDVATFRGRVVAAMEAVIDQNPGRRVVVVTHGGVLNAYLGNVLGVEYLTFHRPAYTGVSRVLAASTGRRQIESVNETAHLRALLLTGRAAGSGGRS